MSTKVIRSKADLAINGAPPAFDQPAVGHPVPADFPPPAVPTHGPTAEATGHAPYEEHEMVAPLKP